MNNTTSVCINEKRRIKTDKDGLGRKNTGNVNDCDNKSIICKYCNKLIKNSKNINYHHINTCLYIPDKIKNKLIEKHNSRKNTKHKIVINNSNSKSITNNITNTNNSNNTNTTNNTQNNLTINISGMTEMNYASHETMDHLTDEEKLEILRAPLRIVELLCMNIYKNKANQNIYLHNRRKNTYKYLDYHTKKIVIGTKESVIRGICDQNMNHIDNLFNDFQSELSMFAKKRIKELLNKYYVEDDPQFNKLLEKEVINQVDQIGFISKQRLQNIIRVNKDGKINYYCKNDDDTNTELENENQDAEITYLATSDSNDGDSVDVGVDNIN
jgi:hypothetical protein